MRGCVGGCGGGWRVVVTDTSSVTRTTCWSVDVFGAGQGLGK